MSTLALNSHQVLLVLWLFFPQHKAAGAGPVSRARAGLDMVVLLVLLFYFYFLNDPLFIFSLENSPVSSEAIVL